MCLNSCYYITNKSVVEITEIIKNQQNLNNFSLDLSRCDKITDDSIMEIVDALDNKQNLMSFYLNLSHCEKIADKSILTLVEMLQNKSIIWDFKVIFTNCPKVSDVARVQLKAIQDNAKLSIFLKNKDDFLEQRQSNYYERRGFGRGRGRGRGVRSGRGRGRGSERRGDFDNQERRPCGERRRGCLQQNAHDRNGDHHLSSDNSDKLEVDMGLKPRQVISPLHKQQIIEPNEEKKLIMITVATLRSQWNQFILLEKEKQRNILGGLLFPMISEKVGEKLAPKITGMLIDLEVLEVSEILEFLEDKDLLCERIEEAKCLILDGNMQKKYPIR